MFLLTLVKALDKAGVKYAVAGGYAVALHGAVRGTVDIDLVVKVSGKTFEAVEKTLRSLGLQPRIPVTGQEIFQFREEYIERRNLIAWSFVNSNDPTQLVDIIITHDLANMRAVEKVVAGTKVKVLSIKDLIAMKRSSGRPQDVEDIAALERL